METKRTISRSAIIIVWTLRIIVGVTFIVSGFVKAIDPWGSVYKFTEYFAVMGLDWMVPFATMSAYMNLPLACSCFWAAIDVWLRLPSPP